MRVVIAECQRCGVANIEIVRKAIAVPVVTELGMLDEYVASIRIRQDAFLVVMKPAVPNREILPLGGECRRRCDRPPWRS